MISLSLLESVNLLSEQGERDTDYRHTDELLQGSSFIYTYGGSDHFFIRALCPEVGVISSHEGSSTRIAVFGLNPTPDQ